MPITVSLPSADVALTPVTLTKAYAITVSLPSAVVPATPVTSTGMGLDHSPCPQVPLPQPVILAIGYYAILIIAFDASAVGN